jgi:hypothetical protein
MKLAVFDFHRTAVQALELLQANGVVEASVLPVTSEVLSPYVVAVAKSRIGDARDLLLESGLLNEARSEV